MTMDITESSKMLMLLVATMVVLVQGELVDIKKEVVNIVRQHNNERRSSSLLASDMMEMGWDEGLARRAEEYVRRCRYQRPPLREYDLGSNLYFESDFVHSDASINRLVNSAMGLWTRNKNMFSYKPHCGRACSYVQIITAQSDRIGCALNTCDNLMYGNMVDNYASLFVCFYSPRPLLQGSYPFRSGYACSECPRGSTCREGLCAMEGREPVPSYLREAALEKNRPQRLLQGPPEDKLSSTESYYITSAHNRMREANSRDPLEWDPFLERWANWVVSCEADYPGPRHCWTNFHRLMQGDRVYDTVYQWSQEGDVTNLQLLHGCRTPNDNARCNHFTNIRQPMITSMACASKDCGDGTRQLVCLYDNKIDRHYRQNGAANLVDSRTDRRRNNRNSRRRRFRNGV